MKNENKNNYSAKCLFEAEKFLQLNGCKEPERFLFSTANIFSAFEKIPKGVSKQCYQDSL